MSNADLSAGSTETLSRLQLAAFRGVGPGKALATILGISGGVFAFLVWLIYFRPREAYSSQFVAALPAVNATLNGVSTVLLCWGLIAIKQRKFDLHLKLMFAALGSSALFLISYVAYHTFHGDTKFTNPGVVKYAYFFVLITHIVLSAVAVPLILTSFYLSLAGRMQAHKRVSKFTFPIWLYVSVTGVLIFAMLKVFN